MNSPGNASLTSVAFTLPHKCVRATTCDMTTAMA
jgi:hypothetical protein